MLIPVIPILDFILLYACVKLAERTWPYPLAAVVFTIGSSILAVAQNEVLAMGQTGMSLIDSFRLFAFSWTALGKFAGAWVLFYFLDKYGDDEFAWLAILAAGFIGLVIVL